MRGNPQGDQKLPAKRTNRCPLCDAELPPEATRCPVCETSVAKAKDTNSKAPSKSIDYVRSEIPRTHLPSVTVTCPLCALALSGEELSCPRCGIPLAASKEVPAEPHAPGTPHVRVAKIHEETPLVVPEAPRKPVEEPPAPATTIETKPAQPSELAESVGLKSIQRPIGLVNGLGQKGGPGLVNGRGAVGVVGASDGTGMTNGLRASEEPAEPAMGPRTGSRNVSIVRRWQFVAVILAVALLIPTFVYLSHRESSSTSIDGDFDEWTSSAKFSMATTTSNPRMSVEEWSVRAEGADLYLYLKAAADLMSTANLDSYYLFADSDGSSATGYSVASIGADYLLQLHGWDGDIQSATVSEYGSTSDLYDWNSWARLGPLEAVVSGPRLEALAVLPAAPVADAKYVLVSQDNLPDQTTCASYPVTTSGGVLIITQDPGSGLSPSGTIPSSSSVRFMQLLLTCDGSGGTVHGITPTVTGAQLVSSIANVEVSLGQEVTIDVLVDSSSAAASALVTATVYATNVSSSFTDVVILGEGVKAYVGSSPATILVDGAFGDWAGKVSPDLDQIASENVDIESVGAVNETSSSFFFVSVRGEMCGGSFVPALMGKPAGPGGGGGIPIRKTGEDVMRVYVDTDLSAATGLVISVPTKTIGADFMIEVTGLNGEVLSKSIKKYSSGRWTDVTGSLEVAKDDSRMELGLSAASIDGASSIDFIIEATDWKSTRDLATAIPQGTKALSAGTLAMMSTKSWPVGPSISNTATSMSYQRKLFYDGTNYWSFFYDGGDTVAKYSTDGGQTWTLEGQVFKNGGVTEVSVWYDSTNNTVYAIGDRAGASRNVYIQKGTVTPATHAITWLGADERVSVSRQNVALKNTFISRDAAGYIWLISTNLDKTTPITYNLTVWKSNAVNSVAAWTNVGQLITGGVLSDSTLKASILPAGAGSDVWAIYTYSGGVYSRKYTGTWGSEETVYQNLGNTANQETAPPCALVDASGVVHVVYGDGHEAPAGSSKPYIYYSYNAGGSWVSPIRLDSVTGDLGNLYPTISLDSSTGDLYVFWIETDSAGTGRTVKGLRNASGTWTQVTIMADSVYEKRHLDSIYWAPEQGSVCLQWTQNATVQMEVEFDKLPEFGTLVVPTGFTIALFFLVGLRRARGSRRQFE